MTPLSCDLEALTSDEDWDQAMLVASRLLDVTEWQRSEFGWLSVRTAEGWCAWIGIFDGQMAVVRRLADGKREMMIL